MAYISQQDRAQRSAEAHTEKLEAWADRLDAAKSNPANLDELCCALDEAFGQGDAWTLVAHLSHMCAATYYDACAAIYYDAKAIVNARTAARDAILSIPQPENDND